MIEPQLDVSISNNLVAELPGLFNTVPSTPIVVGNLQVIADEGYTLVGRVTLVNSTQFELGVDSDSSDFSSSTELRMTKSPDFEKQQSYGLMISYQQQKEGSPVETLFAAKEIRIQNISDVVTDISLTPLFNIPGSTVQMLSASGSEDEAGDYTYSLVEGEGSTDNDSFSIVDGKLMNNKIINSETVFVRLEVKDASGDSYQESFVLDSYPLVGAVGPKGETGATGKRGARGLSGADGSDGMDGTDGLDGLNGSDGVDAPGSSDAVEYEDRFLMGTIRKDYLIGGQGDDTLVGRQKNDELTGGEGADTFVFGSTLNYKKSDMGIDHVMDFHSGEDVLELSGKTFGKRLSLAIVDSRAEVAYSSARIIYNQTTGNVVYNANGAKAGLGGGGTFANLGAGLALEQSDLQLAK